MRPLVVNLRPDAIPNAVRWRLHLTLASGAKVVQNCLSSPCVANVDVRQGGVLAKWSYLDAGQKVIGESDEFVVGIE
jgi:hypothetical protein